MHPLPHEQSLHGHPDDDDNDEDEDEEVVVAGGLVAAVEVEGVDLFPNPKNPICVPLSEDFWGRKRDVIFNAQKRSLLPPLLLLLREDDDEFDDFRFGRISFIFSRGKSRRYRKKTTFFSSQQNSIINSWGEKRQTTTPVWDDGEREQ